ncbi:flagellar assembly protein FlaJ [uncultured archaeon]|nr:flagellar assembly protein FlaJ [uncultured archaeon]
MADNNYGGAKRTGPFTGIEFRSRQVTLILGSAGATGFLLMTYEYTGILYLLVGAAMAGLVLFGILLKPVIERDTKKNDINSNIPFFVTAFATLATSDSNRITQLDILSKKDKLGLIREDLGKIVNLVRNWKRGLSEASMLLAEKTPSDVFADFLSRFAHAIDSGQDFDDFVKTEANTVMSNFETAYQSALYTFELYKDLYVSMLLAFAFLITFVMIMPVLIPINVITVLVLSLMVVALGETMLVYGIKIVLPNDPVWHDTGIKSEVQLKLERIYKFALIGSGGIGAGLYLSGVLSVLPVYFIIPIVMTPLAYPSYLGSKYERKVAKNDDMFGSFIRSLSGSASARGNLVIDALKAIVLHDFGVLTKDVRNLYKRLKYRVNSITAWKYFSADTGSHLIEVFSGTFVESIDLGADAEMAGDIVARNFDRVVRMRRRRHAAAQSYIGVLYGITGGLAFALGISFGVLKIINQIFTTFSTSTLTNFGIFVGQPANSILLIQIFISLILYVHSIIAGLALKIADGGKMIFGVHHAVMMSWIVAVVIYGTLQITGAILAGAL